MSNPIHLSSSSWSPLTVLGGKRGERNPPPYSRTGDEEEEGERESGILVQVCGRNNVGFPYCSYFFKKTFLFNKWTGNKKDANIQCMRDSLLIPARFLNFFFPFQTSFRISLRSNSCSPERKEGKGCLTKAAFSHTTCQSRQQKKRWKQVQDSHLILHTVGKTRKNADLNYRKIFPRPRCHFFSESRWFLSIEATERERERLKQAQEKKRGAGRREVGSFVGI